MPHGHAIHRCFLDGGTGLHSLDADEIRSVNGLLDALGAPRKVMCLPLPGRSQIAGFAVAACASDPAASSSLGPVAALFSRQAGLLLEGLLLHEHARDSLRSQSFGEMVGSTPQMLEMFELLRMVARTDVSALITGETGTGKELVARALHYGSRRKEMPFVAVNCAAIPEDLVESELFGHEKGAFTGSHKRRAGKVEQAAGGTLFLDEISEMPAFAQAKLLRFLQEMKYERVGGEGLLHADVRVIAATNRNVEQAMNTGRLRMDLVHRLNTFTISVPPLRARLRDIPLLTEHFLAGARERGEVQAAGVASKVYAVLMAHMWPGNVRELRNVILRAAVLAGDGEITPDLMRFGTDVSDDVPDLTPADDIFARLYPENDTRVLPELRDDLVERFERFHMDRLLREHGGNVSHSAQAAGIGRKNFSVKMKKYGLNREDYVSD